MNTKSEQSRQSGPQISAPAAGLLYGWLVHYPHNATGSALEIRAGRTLISSHEINQTRTWVIREREIGVPHLAILAGEAENEQDPGAIKNNLAGGIYNRGQVVVQDVFSKSGSYLRRVDPSGNVDETRIQVPTKLKHGDQIRLGTEVVFKVVLINGVVE